MKDMASKLAQALTNWSFTEELLLAEQERSDDLNQELHVLQEQQRMTEKIWSKKTNYLGGQLLV